VLAVIGGASNYHELDVLDNGIHALDASISKPLIDSMMHLHELGNFFPPARKSNHAIAPPRPSPSSKPENHIL
jgi:hypothetical protein